MLKSSNQLLEVNDHQIQLKNNTINYSKLKTIANIIKQLLIKQLKKRTLLYNDSGFALLQQPFFRSTTFFVYLGPGMTIPMNKFWWWLCKYTCHRICSWNYYYRRHSFQKTRQDGRIWGCAREKWTEVLDEVEVMQKRIHLFWLKLSYFYSKT